MRNRLTEAFKTRFGWAAERFRFSWGRTAVVPCGGPPQDQGHNVLRLVGMLQPPVDGVGQADHLTRRGVGLFSGTVMLRHLAGHLVHQLRVGNCDQGAALLTAQIQRVPTLPLSAHSKQPPLAVPATQTFFDSQDRPVLHSGVVGSLSPDDTLDGVEHILIHDNRVPVHSGVARILQQALHLVLVPERRFHAERDTVTVERFRDTLIGTAGDIQRCDPLNSFRLLGNDGQLTVFDVVAIQILSVGHLPTSRSCSVSSMPP